MSTVFARTQDAQTPAAARHAPARVLDAVRQASASTGVDFAYLVEKASVESGFRTDVKAKTSSATGLYQFIDATWLDMVKDHGAKHGLGAYADAIQRRPDGTCCVRDPALKREIMALRKDPRVSALMAGEFAKENKQYLENELGHPVGKAELYMAHFLGAGGAAKFLKALDANPNQAAFRVMPEAANANRAVFFEGGRPRSLGEVFDRFAGKFDGADPQFADSSPFGAVRAADTSSQPWQYGRSAATSLEPLSTFTVMMLDSLAPPTTEEREEKQGGGKAQDGEDDRRMTPNLGPGLMGV